ncbi:unnamed protein product [Cyberlindnera jadinii]|uniref:Uncharacterized protein n=1 Tax=Cyberlindnera jadinii (strain ATCC 18201 / CBS 1600 / BCRC 20928 / JCM 3617 / NBRC 0987 / NRRL Y-1542) TaxID=983966 RepID=A0A0H5C201_CYBJN|nr:unnamed protein product [Cyberlindnera jadinii]
MQLKMLEPQGSLIENTYSDNVPTTRSKVNVEGHSYTMDVTPLTVPASIHAIGATKFNVRLSHLLGKTVSHQYDLERGLPIIPILKL